jgi:hypothetical protein
MSTIFLNLSPLNFSYREIDRSIRTLDLTPMTGGNAALPETLSNRLTRVLQVYGAIRPLLSALTTVSLIPPAWRAALTVFSLAVESLAAMWPEGTSTVSGDFKAGKDV